MLFWSGLVGLGAKGEGEGGAPTTHWMIQCARNQRSLCVRTQRATSAPMGPVYLWAHREVLEEVLEEDAPYTRVDPLKWPALAPSGLSPSCTSPHHASARAR